MVNKKAQSSIELIILVGFLLFIFIVFVGQIQKNIGDKAIEKKNILIRDIVLNVQKEIILATESSNGYYREFKIPEKLINEDYEIAIFNNFVYANTTNLKYAIAVDIPNAIGTVNKGINVIRKESGVVYVNQ